MHRSHGHVDDALNIAEVVQKFVKFIDLPFEEIEKLMNVNFGGTVSMIRAFLPVLLKRPEASLVSVASMASMDAHEPVPAPGQVVYGASEASVRLPTECL